MVCCLQDLGGEFDSSPSECFRRTKEEKNKNHNKEFDAVNANSKPESRDIEDISNSISEWTSPFGVNNKSSLSEESSLCFPNCSDNVKKSDIGHGSVLWILAVSATNLAFGYSDGHIIIWKMETAIRSLELISKETGPILVAGKMKVPLIKEKIDRKKSHFETGSTYNTRKTTKIIKRNTILKSNSHQNNRKSGGLEKIFEDSDDEREDESNQDNVLSEQYVLFIFLII
jgi:hypothetical protein